MFQALMGPVLIVVFHISPNESVQVTFPKDQQMIQTLTPDTTEQALDKGVGFGSMGRRIEDLDPDTSRHGSKASTELVVVVAD